MNPTRAALAIAALAIALPMHSQSPYSASPATQGTTGGPTMPQTIGFITDTLQKQGALHIRKRTDKDTLSQKVRQDQPCTLDVFDTTVKEWFELSMGTTVSNIRYVLDLEASDPHSVRVNHVTESDPDVYEILVDRATFHRAPFDNPTAVEGPVPTSVQGLVQAATADSITVLSDADNTLATYMLNKKSELTMFDDPADPQKARPIAASAIKPGDVVTVEGEGTRKKHGAIEAKRVKDFGDSEFSGIRVFNALTLVNQDKAERISKALTHAITLCHKQEGPSLF